MKKYFYRLLGKYLSYYIRPGNKIVEINPKHNLLAQQLPTLEKKVLYTGEAPAETSSLLKNFTELKEWRPDYILLNGNIHYEKDIQTFLEKIQNACSPSTRVILCYYSALWKPWITFFSKMKTKKSIKYSNWVSPSDIKNFTALTHFEILREEQKFLFPIPIPPLSNFINRWFSPLPFFRWFDCLK